LQIEARHSGVMLGTELFMMELPMTFPRVLKLERLGHKKPASVILGAPTVRDGEATPEMVWPPEECPKCQMDGLEGMAARFGGSHWSVVT